MTTTNFETDFWKHEEIRKIWDDIIPGQPRKTIPYTLTLEAIQKPCKVLGDDHPIYFDEEYAKKPVAIIGVSSGKWGGARMAEAILPTIVTLGMVPISPSIPFPVAQNLFGADGKILDVS